MSTGHLRRVTQKLRDLRDAEMKAVEAGSAVAKPFQAAIHVDSEILELTKEYLAISNKRCRDNPQFGKQDGREIRILL